MIRIGVYVRAVPEPSMAVMVCGGIAVTVDGEPLDRYQNEDEYDWLHE